MLVLVRLVENKMFGVRKDPTGCNFVHNDQIWYVLYGFLVMSIMVRSVTLQGLRCVCRKDHVRRELQTSRKWPNSWGVLANHYRVRQYYNYSVFCLMDIYFYLFLFIPVDGSQAF